MSADGQSVYLLDRFLVLSDQQTRKLTRLRCKFIYSLSLKAIDFSATLAHAAQYHHKINQLLAETQLFLVDEKEQTQLFLGNFPFQHESTFPYENWGKDSITVVYRRMGSHTESSLKARPPKKSRERTIREVRQSIALWRAVYQNGESGKKSLSLVEAAKSIGMSKKSLNDYDRFLKLGERFNFDFQEQEEQKMGVLRNYVRAQLQMNKEAAAIVDLDSYLDTTYRYRYEDS